MQSSAEVLAVPLREVLIVEDDPAMQARLVRLLTDLGTPIPEIVVAGSVGAASALLLQHSFQLALVDIALPDGSGVDLIQSLQARPESPPAVVISAWGTQDIILAALRAGAIGYLLKERDDIELSAALRCIERGGAPIDPFVARYLLGTLQAVPPAPEPEACPQHNIENPLTNRERDILRLVARGLSNREIADTMSISRMTVECHTKNIYRKLVVSSRTEAVYQARQHGLLPSS